MVHEDYGAAFDIKEGAYRAAISTIEHQFEENYITKDIDTIK